MAFMGIFCLCIASLAAAASATQSEEEILGLFEGWLHDNPRPYNGNVSEKNLRFEVFKHNLNIINEHNALESSYKLGLTPFADLTLNEFKNHYLGKLISTGELEPPTSFRYANVIPPAAIDWRTKGAVTPIKNQKLCGSCWAFSTIGAVEGIVQIKTGKLVSLSEQELVSCDKGTGQSDNFGCSGGWMYTSFGWIVDNGGIDSEQAYPYTAQDDPCKKRKLGTRAASIDGREKVPANNEKALQQAVANQPVSVALDASDMKFALYTSGIVSGACGTMLDHAVVAVGYDTTSSGEDYWILKNSWGKNWGEHGYIRLRRNVASLKGMCGIAMASSYPIKH
ncbi:unnamed protein product [Calypogeia fissa]